MGFNCPKTSTLSSQKFLVHFNNLGIRSKSTLGPPRVLNTESLDCESSALITRSLLLNKSISSNVGDLYSKCTQIKIGNLTGFRRVLGETTRSGTRALQVLKYTWSPEHLRYSGTQRAHGHLGNQGTWSVKHSGAWALEGHVGTQALWALYFTDLTICTITILQLFAFKIQRKILKAVSL